MNTADFEYPLPDELIAQYPVEPRDAARLMVVHRRTGDIEHRTFREIVEYLAPGDGLVVNRTRVMPARLKGVRAETGGKVEVLLVREVEPGLWEGLLRAGSRLVPGTKLVLGDGVLSAEVAAGPEADRRYLRFPEHLDVRRIVERVGHVPLPPYIRREPVESDRTQYQTVYADAPGAVAAPTAGLHFTEPLLEQVRARGVRIIPILLHVGPGTFRPVKADRVEDHAMEAEFYRVEADAARQIVETRSTGRVVAVGTTVVRALETIAAGQADDEDDLAGRTYEGWTTRFIHPPYRFRLIDALVTNFHLPRSTLLMLVCAFTGRELTLRAYEEAVHERYRFYSYGDAMVIV